MTATATAPATRETHIPASPYRLTFFRQLRSELIKLVTLRSTWWSVGIVLLLTVGIAMMIAAAMNTPGYPGIQAVINPIQFTMLLAGILGAIAVTGEYSTGMIRSTLAADPVRGSVLAAKATVLAVFMFVVSVVTFGVAALAASPILDSKDMGIDWSDAEMSILPILAASVSMAVFALIGVAFGFILRSGAGAIAATVALLFVLPIMLPLFSMAGPDWQWILDAGNYLPMSAAQSVIIPQEDVGLDVATGYLALAGWVVAGMLTAWAVLRGRDA